MEGPDRKKSSLSGDLEASGLIKEASSESMSFLLWKVRGAFNLSRRMFLELKALLGEVGRV